MTLKQLFFDETVDKICFTSNEIERKREFSVQSVEEGQHQFLLFTTKFVSHQGVWSFKRQLLGWWVIFFVRGGILFSVSMLLNYATALQLCRLMHITQNLPYVRECFDRILQENSTNFLVLWCNSRRHYPSTLLRHYPILCFLVKVHTSSPASVLVLTYTPKDTKVTFT